MPAKRNNWTDTNSKTAKPNVDHTVAWKKGNIIKCQMILKLIYNQRRRYTCNSNDSMTEN